MTCPVVYVDTYNHGGTLRASPSHPIRTMENHQTICRECREPATVLNRFGLCDECHIVDHALNAFWAVVAASHPEITTGDGDDTEIRQQCRRHIREWVSNNSVSCDECDRNCTTDGIHYEQVDTGDRFKTTLCQDCLSKRR